MDKHTLRNYFKNFLAKNYPKIAHEATRKAIISKINKLINDLKVTKIGLYYPLKYEINLLEIINLQPNLEFFLPKIIANEIRYYRYKLGDELVLNNYNIYQPTGNDYTHPQLIIIPGLAFSKDMYRLGWGKGFFDHYISTHQNLLTIGVCLKEQLLNDLPINLHDRKVNFIISG
jgi:5-formyltetrahydrofolate cyclo-ligase